MTYKLAEAAEKLNTDHLQLTCSGIFQVATPAASIWNTSTVIDIEALECQCTECRCDQPTVRHKFTTGPYCRDCDLGDHSCCWDIELCEHNRDLGEVHAS